MQEMDPDLVGPARLDPHAKKAAAPRPRLLRGVLGQRFPSARGPGGHLLAVMTAAADQRPDRPRRRRRRPPHQRQVFLVHGACLELCRKTGHRGIVLRHDHHPARVLVQPVHDPRPSLAPHPGQVGTPVKQGVDQRAGPVSRGGMHHEARFLVEHDDVAILEQRVNRDVFRLKPGRTRFRPADHDPHALADLVVRTRGGIVHRDVSFTDQRLQARAGHSGNMAREEDVEPETGITRGRRQFHAHLCGSGTTGPLPRRTGES